MSVSEERYEVQGGKGHLPKKASLIDPVKRRGGGGETPGIHTGLANPLARFANSSFSLESGGTAKPCSHTVHWFPAGCALCREWPGGPEPGAGVLPPLPSAPHCVGLGVGF